MSSWSAKGQTKVEPFLKLTDLITKAMKKQDLLLGYVITVHTKIKQRNGIWVNIVLISCNKIFHYSKIDWLRIIKIG